MTELMQHMSGLIATEGDTGFLIAADEFEDSNDNQNVMFGRLLRLYVDISGYIRMSQPIPVTMVDEFKALNSMFDIPDVRHNYECHYTDQLGPFYTKLSTTQEQLANNLDWLVNQPVRELELRDMSPGTDLKMIFRNHRFETLKRVTIRPHYRVRNIADIANAVKEMKAFSLNTLTFQWGINDRLGLIKAAFAGNKTIPRGAELFNHRQLVWTHK